jgi:predicted nucleic acid-binding protein
VAALTRETQSESAASWLGQHRNDDLAICDWTITEFASAMSLKLRSKQMSRMAYVAAHSEFEQWVKRQLTVLPIETDHFHHATAFCNDWTSGLRAPDALQLAASFMVGGTLVTLDETLHRAANMIGLWAELPS